MGGVSEIQEDREGQVTQTCLTLFVGCDSETICRAGSTFFDSGRDKTAADLETVFVTGAGVEAETQEQAEQTQRGAITRQCQVQNDKDLFKNLGRNVIHCIVYCKVIM